MACHHSGIIKNHAEMNKNVPQVGHKVHWCREQRMNMKKICTNRQNIIKINMNLILKVRV